MARFCELNGLNARRCIKFLDVDPDNDAPLSGDAIGRLSAVLREPLPLVQSVFAPRASFDGCGRYGPPPVRRERDLIRYCKACSRHGYHSYLHEVSWLSRCPFHLTPLETVSLAPRSGTAGTLKVSAWQRLMREHSVAWPHYREEGFPTDAHGQVGLLVGWVTRASRAAVRVSQGERWRSRDHTFCSHPSLAQVFAQLHQLEAMPAAIAPLFTVLGGDWLVETRSFPRQARLELDRLKQRGLSFDCLLDVYKRLDLRSATSPRTHIRVAQDRLGARHGTCHCRWELVNRGWESHWSSVPVEERRRRDFICPFDVARAALEHGSGRQESEALSRHHAEREWLRLMTLAHEMHGAGLIRAPTDARGPSAETAIHEPWLGWQWMHDAPLTGLLAAAAAWDIASTASALAAWLDAIDRGRAPSAAGECQDCVRLGETEAGLALVRWRRARPDNPAQSGLNWG